jgi:tetratricopeptide (TPR) repeat protein
MIMRTVMIAMASAAMLTQPDPAAVETYRAAVAAYLASGNAAESVKRLVGWTNEQFDVAVQTVLRRADPKELEAAAAVHLEIGIAVVGLSNGAAQGYLEHGSKLITAVLPPADIRRGLSAERLNDIAMLSATWHRVAATAFLSVNDGMRARLFADRAARMTPKSAAVLTVLGMIDEVEAGLSNPDDWDAIIQQNRAGRERARLLVRAEESFKAAMNADPDYALAPIRMGRVEFLRGDFRKAQTYLERGSALAREPRHQYLASMFTGALQQEQNNLADARTSFERALAIAPQSQNAVVALSYVEMMSGRAGRAQQIARGFTSAPLDEAWWAYKTGTLDIEGLQWLRQRVRK